MAIKRGCFQLFLIFLICLLSGSLSCTKTADVIELSYTDHFPPNHIHSKLAEAWCREVEKRTGGRIKITYYPGETLISADKVYNGILSGIADIGHSVFGYNRGVFPAMESFSLPHGFRSAPEATRVVNEFYKHFKLEELSKVKILYLHAHGPAMLHSKKKIERLEDMHGVKVRSYGFNAAMVKALGGIPVSMSMGEVYEALSKGVVDATFSPIEALKGWKQAEVVDYSIGIEGVAYSTALYVMMNKEKWESLPQDVKETIEEINQEWIPKVGEAWVISDEEGKEYTLAQNNEVYELDKEESDRWARAVSPVVEDYVADTQKKGLPGQDYVDFIRDSIKKGRK